MSNRGDPEGRRLADRQAALLSEAGRLAKALEALTARAGADTAMPQEIAASLARQEAIALQKAHGRIESRRRFKAARSQSAASERQVNLLFVDESGKSHPETPPPYFALGAVAMSESAALDYVGRADALKSRFFGTTAVTFHEPLMRNREGAFYFNGDSGKQEAFDDELHELISSANFTIFGAGIRKEAFRKEFVDTGIDPYLPADVYTLAITLLMERYLDFLAYSETSYGRVTFESQGPKEDAIHQFEYARLLLDGTQWAPESAFRSLLEPGLRFSPKQGSDPMELADLVARELFEWIRGGCVIEPKRWNTLMDKAHCRGDGRMGAFGIKVFPDSDIRSLIEGHRRKVIGARRTQ